MKYFVKQALLDDGWADQVVIETDGAGYITGITTKQPDRGAVTLDGILIPGIANVHSHCHQRAMAGLAEHSGKEEDSFWTWRHIMYRFLGKMTPQQFHAITAMLYLEMLKAGYTSVGEFHYLHHQANGKPYDNVAEMSLQIVRAAEQCGIAVTLLPVLYRYGGFDGQTVDDRQKRFVCDADLFLQLFESLQTSIAGKYNFNLGIAPHSLRAVSEQLLTEVLGTTQASSGHPVHIHIAEQSAEVDDCIAWSKQRPVQWLLHHFDVDQHWCLVHATHIDTAEIQALAKTQCVAGLCPVTEANLGDGLFPVVNYLQAQGTIAIGSDSQISINPVEEIRWLEYGQRLRSHQRNVLAGGFERSTGMNLLQHIYRGGAQALQRSTGRIAVGYRADFITLNNKSPALIHRQGDQLIDSWLFASNNSQVCDVVVGGKLCIQQGHHEEEASIFQNFQRALAELQQS